MFAHDETTKRISAAALTAVCGASFVFALTRAPASGTELLATQGAVVVTGLATIGSSCLFGNAFSKDAVRAYKRVGLVPRVDPNP